MTLTTTIIVLHNYKVEVTMWPFGKPEMRPSGLQPKEGALVIGKGLVRPGVVDEAGIDNYIRWVPSIEEGHAGFVREYADALSMAVEIRETLDRMVRVPADFGRIEVSPQGEGAFKLLVPGCSGILYFVPEIELVDRRGDVPDVGNISVTFTPEWKPYPTERALLAQTLAMWPEVGPEVEVWIEQVGTTPYYAFRLDNAPGGKAGGPLYSLKGKTVEALLARFSSALKDARGRPQWMADFESAYQRANGKPIKVVHRGRGWYLLRSETGIVSPFGVRRAEIERRTAVLEQRIEEG